MIDRWLHAAVGSPGEACPLPDPAFEQEVEMPDIKQSRILIMATDGFEQSELMVPLQKLKESGAIVHVATPDKKAIKGWNKKDWGETVQADCSIAEVSVADYDALVLPGGQINPDLLRLDATAVKLVRDFASAGKIVAAICHAPWMLVQAGIAKGRTLTSYQSIRTDVENAGANWVDKEVVVDNGIVTSRSPKDLDVFVAKVIEEVSEGKHRRR
jgi:protease I